MLKLTRIRALVLVAVAVAAVAASMIAQHRATGPSSLGAADQSKRFVGGDMMYAAAPNYNDPPDKKLDAALALPGMRGVLEVTITSGPVGQELAPVAIGNRPPRPASIVSNWTAHVDGYYGSRDNAFVPGQQVVVQTLGGSVNGRTLAWEASPPLASGMHIMIFVRQWTHYLDGSATTGPDVIYIPDSQYFASEVGGFVNWMGTYETRSTFITHFVQHPVPAGN